ncbi:MAG TPA: alkaline phosphatase family protein [Anditalea sp.]|nr:alkaline phosphatase family protein [Anditalea sp.]
MTRLLIFIVISAIFFHTKTFAQVKRENPKIVVGLVIDQMRQEYLFKFKERYGEGGFKRLMEEGFMMKNAHLNYIPTYTGPGHASIYTGTTPSSHGIIANDWFLREGDRFIYCVEDRSRTNIEGSIKNGYVSPKHLKTTTITDELKLSSNHRSKVISIGLKDRAAILPAGHLGDAYWYDGITGEFMTSDYYKSEAPQWLIDFNARELPRNYLNQVWETLYPIETYIQSISDNNNYEAGFEGKATPEFPYDLQMLRLENGGFGLLRDTPFGISLTFDMAYAALRGENLGQGEETDFLAISITPTDYIGHKFGPTSVEIEDTYLRLDRDIELFLDSLDHLFGKNEYLLFLTSDHGVADFTEYMQDQGLPVENIALHELKAELRAFSIERYGKLFRIENYIITGIFILISFSLSIYFIYHFTSSTKRYIWLAIIFLIFSTLSVLYLIRSYNTYKERKENWITEVTNQQIFLNRDLIYKRGLDLGQVRRDIAEYAKSMNGMKEVYTSSQLTSENYISGNGLSLKNGFVEELSGDIMLVFKPFWVPIHWKGTTHGSGYSYDTHIPVVFYGWDIGNGESEAYSTITDIAPTLSMILNISLPSGNSGSPLIPVLESRNK